MKRNEMLACPFLLIAVSAEIYFRQVEPGLVNSTTAR